MNNTEPIVMTIGTNNRDIDISIQEASSSIGFEIKTQTTGTKDYNKLSNKPSVNDITLIGNKTSEDLGLQPAGEYANSKITNLEIDTLF